jgi:hypothetical protein
MKRTLGVAAALIAAFALSQTVPDSQQTTSKIDPNDLRADVSFLASDALEGRATPSRGLDIAAEYLAAQFRRSGLEPAGDDGYFQSATYILVKPSAEGLDLTLTIGERKFVPDKNSITVLQPGPLNLEDADAVVMPASEQTAPVEVTPGGAKFPSERYNGKVVITDLRNMVLMSRSRPKFIIIINTPGDPLLGGANSPSPGFGLREASAPAPSMPPIVFIADPALRSALRETNDAQVSVTARIPAPTEESVKVRNVIGVLRGSDPRFKDTCVVVSAHYDHAGISANTQGDNIFNGANDDASGAAGVIAIAKALATQASHPKRSIAFLEVFGEERGELGSRYYAHHPVFPIVKTIANINLEQIGRTDSSEGPRLLQFNLTGHDYTTLAAVFEKASQGTGVQVVKDAANTERYFGGSDNISFAEVGVPSTTISVTYQFPDYHAPGDEWPKLDYENMAKVVGAVASGVFRLADSNEVPRWNTENPRTARYVKAREAAGMK